MRAKWTNDEIKLIYDNYQTMKDSELAIIIPDHTEAAITTKRKRLGLHRTNRKYTYEDVIKTCTERGYILLSKDFTSCANNIDFICSKHPEKGIQHVTYGHMLEGKGCYWCGRQKTDDAHRSMITLEQKINICEINNLEYVGCNYKDKLLNIEFYCKRHRDVGIQTMRYNNMKRGICGCRYCAKEKGIVISKGEKEVIKFLKSLDINFVQQKTFDDCKDINSLPFDFYLFDHHILIEFDGEQHYFPVRFHGMSQEDAENNFIIVQKHDNIKNKFCMDNNIKLIRIPYTERNHIGIWLQEKYPSIFTIQN